MLELAAGAVLVSMALYFVRACMGPTVFDRILAVNAFATMTVLWIALDGFLNDRPEFLDLALIYGLLGFLTTIAVLRFFRYGSFAREEDEHP